MEIGFGGPKKGKGIAAMILKMHPAHKGEEESEEGEGDEEGLLAASEELINAVKEGNKEAVASALKNAFYICDSMPHEEGEHEGEEEEESEY